MDGVAVAAETLEWSLPVPSVQELATRRPETVPERYIRDDMENIAAIDPSGCPSLVVPLIDMNKLRNNNDSQQQAVELHKLYSACKDWGVFQLQMKSIKKMREQAKEFFDLPLQEKKRSAQQPGSLEGYGQAFVTSKDQKLEWNDMIFLRTLPAQRRNMSLWPQQPPSFRETLGNYSENMREVAVCLMKFMAKALKVEDEKLSQNFQEGNYEVRMNYYPPCPASERVLGLNPHADISGITLLLECGDMPGLQVLKDGQWVFVEPIHDAIVVNLGQIIEVTSNGIFKAPQHRAVANGLKERLSVVTFCYPSSSANIGPAEPLIKLGTPPLYKTVTNEEYFHYFFNRKFDDPFIDMLKLKP
ncbi:protein SRG1-like [Durio zibethinus]|uniref:Protein SRG1-like n=1 Tax=Durio zibethinus TaxID=66656 RepID=A0A6P5ZP14_DURZI|nr:protein SRG1-like [Durio zibethinus]